jgi:predicted negative regulator of RcsB-dependent stress response
VASLALAHLGLCLVYDQQGRFDEALPHAQEALRLRSSLSDSAGTAYAENYVGWIYANLGQPAEALRHCQRALELHRESGSRSGAADTLDSIGFAHRALGEHEAAIDHYRQSLELFRELGDPHGEAAALTGLGDVQLAVGQQDDARRSWEMALSIVTAIPGENSEPVRSRLASLQGEQLMSSFQPDLAGQLGWCAGGWRCSRWWGRLGVVHDRLSAGGVLAGEGEQTAPAGEDPARSTVDGHPGPGAFVRHLPAFSTRGCSGCPGGSGGGRRG